MPPPAALPKMKYGLDVPSYTDGRSRRRRLHRERTIETIRRLNELNSSCVARDGPRASASSCRPAPSVESPQTSAHISRARASALRRILAAHISNPPPRGVPTGHGALSELIKCRSLFSLEAARVAKYNPFLCNVLRKENKRKPLVDLASNLSGKRGSGGGVGKSIYSFPRPNVVRPSRKVICPLPIGTLF